MYLPLAERMTQKYVADDKIQAEAGQWGGRLGLLGLACQDKGESWIENVEL